MNKEYVLKGISKIEDKLLVSKVFDKILQCEKLGRTVHTDFLDPHQRKLLEEMLKSTKDVNYIFSGGINGAERVVLFFCPDFILSEEEDQEEYFSVLKLKVKEGQSLTHRDYLGSLMGLGIKREKTGDIFVSQEGAHILVLKEIADFIKYNLSKVGNFKVDIDEVSISAVKVEDKEQKEINTTVASLRLDCIASAGFGISRTKITEYIKGERVSVNWDSTKDSTKTVKAGDTISLKGKGRIILDTVGNNTRKGRIAIILKKIM